MSMKNSIDTVGNRTRDLPTCSAVPQPTAPLRAPDIYAKNTKYIRYTTCIISPLYVTVGGPKHVANKPYLN